MQIIPITSICSHNIICTFDGIGLLLLIPNEAVVRGFTMHKTPLNRRKRCQQASSSGCRADARLTSVSCQRGNQHRNLSDWNSLGIGTHADCLWQHRIADHFSCEQSNVPKQDHLWCRIT